MPLDYSVAIVTGASSGIGAELARQLAMLGVRVGLVALPGDELDAQAKAIRASGGVAVAHACDVSDPEANRAAVDRLTTELGPVDLLIANAGIGMATPVTAFRGKDVADMVNVNLLGPTYAIAAVLPAMLARGRGHIVGMSSLSSYRGQPIFSGYCATKAGLGILLEGLRAELRPRGIYVTTVRPGFVRTPMTAKIPAPRGVVEVEPAVGIILRGIAKKQAEVHFPRPAAWVMGIARWIPCRFYDRLAARVILGKFEQETPDPTGLQR